MQETDPKVQKSLARKVRNFDEEQWNKISVDVVKRASIEKVIHMTLLLFDILWNNFCYQIYISLFL